MKKHIERSTVISLAGIGLSLLSLVIIFSQNTVFSFLTTIIVRPFGFIGFWIILPFLFILGLYMLLKQKLVKFKLGLSLWGVLIVIFSLLILTSSWAEQSLVPGGELNFGNMSPTYVEALVELGDNPYNTAYGGGLVGYFLAAILYSAITKIGAQIVCWLLIVTGLCLIFNHQIKKLYLLIKGKKSNAKHQQDGLEQEEDVYSTSMEEMKEDDVNKNIVPQEVAPQPIKENPNDLAMRNFNNTHSLKKVQFSFGEEVEDDFIEAPQFSSSDSFGSPSFTESENSLGEDLVNESGIEDNIPENVDELLSNNDVNNEEVAPQEDAPVVEVDKLHKPQPKAHPIKNYVYPPLDLLDYHEDSEDANKNTLATQTTIEKINLTYQQLGVGAQVVGYTVGPSVTRYDVQPNSNVSVNYVQRYTDDISMRLNGVPMRFEKIVAGKSTCGLEIPNTVRTPVGLRESIEKLPPISPKTLRVIPFGKNISGDLLSADLSDFPHMLVSGTTGSGKTIFMHSVILSLIMRNKPDEIKIVLIDPKKVEMAYYEKIPHLLCPNISDAKKSYVAMTKLVDEMERRYNLFAANRVRDIKGFNELAKTKGIQTLPYIVVFIDEYADLVEEVKDIKTPVVRIAQKARAAGIHLVIATQRPSVNVIDGVIKANVSVRVALMVASQVDSISVIGEAGAEKLLGYGDMIVDCSLISRSMKPRVQGCFVDVNEIVRVCDFLRNHYPEQYDPEFLDLEEHNEPANGGDASLPQIDKDMEEEKLYELIKESIVERDYCSISYIQRTYGVGFPKAGRLMNKLINDGYVARSGDARGSKVLMKAPKEQQMGTIEQSTFVPDEGDNSKQ